MTGHNPRPATFNPDRCAICGARITRVVALLGDDRVPTKRYIHVVDTTLFDGPRQKTLYERLDTIADALNVVDDTDDPETSVTLPELAEVLRTLHGWRDHVQLWRVVRRWLRDHGEEL